MKIELVVMVVAWLGIVAGIVFFERQAMELSNIVYSCEECPSIKELRSSGSK